MDDLVPTAEARRALVNGGLRLAAETTADGQELKADFKADGSLDVDFDSLSTEYWVRTVPGSLVEMEDEKQMRILNQLLIPLSQALPALAASGNQQALSNATSAMQFIVQREIELSGSTHSADLKALWTSGPSDALTHSQQVVSQFEDRLAIEGTERADEMGRMQAQAAEQAEQIRMLRETLEVFGKHMGMPEVQTAAPEADLSYSA